MGASYRFVACDLRTNQILEHVRLSDVSYEETLNRKGSLTASLHRSNSTSRRDVIAEAATALYVVRNDVAVPWGGYVSNIDAKGSDRTLKVGCQGFLGYYERRFLRESRTYTQVDEAEIASDLVAYTVGEANTAYGATVGPGGGIPMARLAPATGQPRDRTYDGFERPYIGNLLQQLTEVEGGPDVGVITTMATDAGGNETFDNTFTVWNVRGSATQHALIHGAADVSDYAVTYSAANLATYAEAMNDADSSDRLVANASTGAPLVWDDVITRSKVTDQNTLQGWANAHLATYGSPLVMPTIELSNPTDVVPGTLQVGDTARVAISDGYVQIDGTYRVVAWKVSIGEGGSEKLSIAFAPPEVTGATP